MVNIARCFTQVEVIRREIGTYLFNLKFPRLTQHLHQRLSGESRRRCTARGLPSHIGVILIHENRQRTPAVIHVCPDLDRMP